MAPSGRGRGGRSHGPSSVGGGPSRTGGGPSGGTAFDASGSLRQHSRGRSSGGVWQGRAFYVQLERCCGISDQVVSVRLDEDKYIRQCNLLHAAIEEHFCGQLPVVVLDVNTLYAMEVRVMPFEAHPKHGRRLIAQEAEMVGGKTIFSKILTKKWPIVDIIIQQLEDFCRVPLRVTLLGQGLKTGSSGNKLSPIALEVQEAINSGLADDGEEAVAHNLAAPQLEPLPHATVHCSHNNGQARELHTSATGEVEVVLFPGNFTLTCDEGGIYDRLTPSVIAVPARFALLEISITASMKKQCTFLVVDHLNRPFPRFPVRLMPREQAVQHKVVRMVTKVNGRGRARLGHGIYLATFSPDEGAPQESWVVAPFAQELEVRDTEVPQFFRICVHRVRFTCDLLLRTRFDEPVALCPFSVRRLERPDKVVSSGLTTDIGVASCDLPAGRFILKLEPAEDAPFVQTILDVQVSDDATFTPLGHTVETKTVDVRIHLITPDGEPACECNFFLVPRFPERGGRAWEMVLRTDDGGAATATMNLLEPYIFRVKETGKAAEYMAQEFAFLTDRRYVTAVVARTIFGPIPESRVAIVVDTSGSMQAYLGDVKAALNLAIVQQFHGSSKQFNIVTYTERPHNFRPGLVGCTPHNIEDALRFCESLEAGGSSNLLGAIAHTLRMPNLEAMYLVTDGKCEVGEEFLARVRAVYFTHPTRPKINTIGINCVPQRLTYRGLRALASLAQSAFRPVCLEQEVVDLMGQLAGAGGPPGGDLAAPTETHAPPRPEPTTDEAEGNDEQHEVSD